MYARTPKFSGIVGVMIILLHSSKTMRTPSTSAQNLSSPQLLEKAQELDAYLKSLSPAQLTKVMGISKTLADKTYQRIAQWTTEPAVQTSAIDSFLGDIYSGLQVTQWTPLDRKYAHQHLYILSGLYGVLKALDGIYPYRLEMGYRLPKHSFANLYTFWGPVIADTFPVDQPIINLSSVEYSKTVTLFVDEKRIITPRFLSVNPKTGEPTFVVVHAKIARGAFASWLIRNKVTDPHTLNEFADIGYHYDPKTSTAAVPVFICHQFGGIGLSMRLS